MSDEAVRAHVFGRVADAYERSRPSYPPEAVAWLLAAAPGRRVVDLGAGTGKLTRVLAASGAEVTAVEPDDAMRAALDVAVPGVRALAGSAEAIPLPDRSADLVVAGQAFHWFDPALAPPEIARVLVPGGVLGAVWNTRDDRVPWVAELTAILDGAPDTVSSGPPPALSSIVESPLFGEIEEAAFAFAQRLDRELLLDLVATRSGVVTQDETARRTTLAAAARLVEQHPDLRGRDAFELPYLTLTYRARRI